MIFSDTDRRDHKRVILQVPRQPVNMKVIVSSIFVVFPMYWYTMDKDVTTMAYYTVNMSRYDI